MSEKPKVMVVGPRRPSVALSMLATLAACGLDPGYSSDHRRFNHGLETDIELNREKQLSYADKAALEAAELKRQRKAAKKAATKIT